MKPSCARHAGCWHITGKYVSPRLTFIVWARTRSKRTITQFTHMCMKLHSAIHTAVLKTTRFGCGSCVCDGSVGMAAQVE
jgi:hypothetical protein